MIPVLMEPETAREIASLFAAMFPVDATYLYNRDGECGSSPVPKATMESAFVIAHPYRVGLMVVMDED